MTLNDLKRRVLRFGQSTVNSPLSTGKHWTVLPNFVDCSVFHPAVNAVEKRAIRETMGVPADAFVVGCVAAVKKDHKRIDYLINEFAQYQTIHGQNISNMDIQDTQDKGKRTASSELSCKSCLSMLNPSLSPPYLLIVGSRTDETTELLALAESLIPGRYKIMTNCARDQMPNLLRAMDVFVLTSLFEMMPIALLEALASGLPCLVNQHPVLEWMIGTEYEKSIEQKTAKSTKGENVAPQRHRDTEKKMQCGVYFTHGNTVAKINATLLEGKVEGEEQSGFANKESPLSLFPLQEGLRGFKAEYSPPSIPATLDSSVLSSQCLSASVVNPSSSCSSCASVQTSSFAGGLEINMSKEGALAQALSGLTPEWLEQHGRQARERAVAMFSKEAVIGKYVEYYREVMGEE